MIFSLASHTMPQTAGWRYPRSHPQPEVQVGDFSCSTTHEAAGEVEPGEGAVWTVRVTHWVASVAAALLRADIGRRVKVGTFALSGAAVAAGGARDRGGLATPGGACQTR